MKTERREGINLLGAQNKPRAHATLTVTVRLRLAAVFSQVVVDHKSFSEHKVEKLRNDFLTSKSQQSSVHVIMVVET